MGAPTVSVITAVYNAGRFVEAAIASILAQTYRDLEVIVVDDGSTDDTAARVAAFGPRVTMIAQANGGVAAALNTGIRHSRGAYVTFLDADDVWLPQRMARVMDAFARHSEAGAVYHGYAPIDAMGRPIGHPFIPTRSASILEPLLCGLFVGQSMITFKRSYLDRAGLFDPAMRMLPDWDCFVRIALGGCVFECVPEALVHYRLHDCNASRNFAGVIAYGRVVLDRAFADPKLPVRLRTDAFRAQAYGQLSISVAARYLQWGRWPEGLALLLDGVRLEPRILLRPSFYLDFAQRALPMLPAGEPGTGRTERADRAAALLSKVLAGLFQMPDLPHDVAKHKRGAWSALWVATGALHGLVGRRPLVAVSLARAFLSHPPTVTGALARASTGRWLSARSLWQSGPIRSAGKVS